MSNTPNRWKRHADWDEHLLRLDRFPAEDPIHGFSARHRHAGLAQCLK